MLCIDRLRASCWFDCIQLCENIVFEYSHVQKLMHGIRHRATEEGKKVQKERRKTTSVVGNKG
jgi:hypothetical protein